MRIVETNITYKGLTVYDHQSRVLEIPSWKEYCDLFRTYNGEAIRDEDINYKNIYNTSLRGLLLPSNVVITNLKIDDYHLTCNMDLNGIPHYKLAYVIEK
jgi:hypothetical protein